MRWVRRPAAVETLLHGLRLTHMIIEIQKRAVRGQKVVVARVSGTGTAQTLPMSEKQKKEAERRERDRQPFGFAR
jgi:hypothetical protein